VAQPTSLPSASAQQQAAVEVFAQYEPPLYEAYLEMMLEWLAAVKTAMFAGGIATLGLVPDPFTVFSQTPKWTALTTQYAEQVAREVLAAPYKDLFADGTVFESRPFVRNWIAARENRLQAVPNEVFGLVSHIVDSATTNGASIPDVQAQIEQLFSDTSIPNWKNRARTVARTEVVGAYNGGLNDAFAMIVANDPDTAWVKRWLATEDQRTRPDHREADGQTVPFAQPFMVGGTKDEAIGETLGAVPMMHPHDPSAPANQVVNCRCVELLEIENEPTEMGNRQYKGPPTLKAAVWAPDDDARHDPVPPSTDPDRFKAVVLPPPPGLTLMQAVCTDGSFCMQTHKPGLCKGQKRGDTEPGEQDATKQTPAQVAQTAVNGLSQAIAQAQAVAAQNATNPKLAAMARRAIAGYRKALAPHQQTLKQAASTNAKAKATGAQDAKQQDTLDKRAQAKAVSAAKKHETLEKRAQAILDRRAEAARVAKMTPKQRAAYGKAKSAQAKAKHQAAEAKVLKDAGRG
jgi:hypothetical protein